MTVEVGGGSGVGVGPVVVDVGEGPGPLDPDDDDVESIAPPHATAVTETKPREARIRRARLFTGRAQATRAPRLRRANSLFNRHLVDRLSCQRAPSIPSMSEPTLPGRIVSCASARHRAWDRSLPC